MDSTLDQWIDRALITMCVGAVLLVLVVARVLYDGLRK